MMFKGDFQNTYFVHTLSYVLDVLEMFTETH